MSTLSKLLQEKVSKDPIFFISTYLCDRTTDTALVDRLILLFKHRTVMNINEKSFVHCLKERNPKVVEIDSLSMLKDHYFYDEIDPVDLRGPDPIQEEDPELTPGPKAEFKKTPLESLKKKKMVQAVSPSPLLKGLLGTK